LTAQVGRAVPCAPGEGIDIEPISIMPPDVATGFAAIIPAAKGLAALPAEIMGNSQCSFHKAHHIATKAAMTN